MSTTFCNYDKIELPVKEFMPLGRAEQMKFSEDPKDIFSDENYIEVNPEKPKTEEYIDIKIEEKYPVLRVRNARVYTRKETISISMFMGVLGIILGILTFVILFGSKIF